MDDVTRRDEVDLYATDFYAWSQQQAVLLGIGDFLAVDLVNLVEEIESLGRAQISALSSRYEVLCLHLLELIVQPERGSPSWHGTIAEQRTRIARLIKQSPSLQSTREELFAESHEDSRTVCEAQTGIPRSMIPDHPPFPVDQAEDRTWRPDPAP